jgi:serine/threonine protein kinase
VPKLSDFGLAKMLEMEETKVFTDVRGTIGYMDPEYITHSKLTCASDIYSFGVVALQLLSGRKVIELDIVARDSLTKKVIHFGISCCMRITLVSMWHFLLHANFFCTVKGVKISIIFWAFISHRKVIYVSYFFKAKDVVSGKKPLEEFIDPRVRDDVIIEDFVLILKIAVLCVASSSTGRPTI